MRKKYGLFLALATALLLAGCDGGLPRAANCRKRAPSPEPSILSKARPPELPRQGNGAEPDMETVQCAGPYTATIHRSIPKSGGRADYTVTQGMDGTTFVLAVRPSGEWSYRLSLMSEGGELLQAIADGLYTVEGVGFLDVNLDGCADIQVFTGGTMNEAHDLYLWDMGSQAYVKVLCEEMLSYFEPCDGYLKNWIKESASSGWYQELYWEGNALVKRFEAYYDLEGEPNG